MIKALITDFDGTLVDTKQANTLAYKEAFAACGVQDFTDEKYDKYFGLNFKDLCQQFESLKNDTQKQKNIKEYKKHVYPLYFKHVKFNYILYNLIKSQHINDNAITCIASTASYDNLHNLLHYISENIIFENVYDAFDIILSAKDVEHGKPNPEVYLKAYDMINEISNINKNDILIFEDSEHGIKAAEAADINYMKIKI